MDAGAVSREKSNFITRLDDSRKVTADALANSNPESVIYSAPGWRIKDIIAHLAGWEREVITSLNAYNTGREYHIPDFTNDDDYNDQLFQRNKDLPTDQIYTDWHQTRADFKTAILAVPAETFEGEIMCPWGLTSGITGIVNDMIGHEAEHLHDIQMFVHRSSPELD
jgi:hypothetical protein